MNEHDDDTDNNEILFWKVFHNKFLFNYILYQLEITELVTTNKLEGYCFNNRKKFKDITNFNWIIENGLYKLLNYKLRAGEDIIISDYGFRGLLNLKEKESHFRIKEAESFRIRYCSRFKSYYRDGDENIFKNEIMELSKEAELRKESLSLFLKHKSSQLKKFNLVEILIGDSSLLDCRGVKYKPNLELLHIFTSKPFNFSITTKIFEGIIKNFDYKYREYIIEFILNNPQLYINRRNKKMGVFKLNEFLTIKSSSIQIRLLELGYIEFNKKKKSNIKINDNIISIGDRIKDLYKQYIEFHKENWSKYKKVREIYDLYLVKYEEVIEGFDDVCVLKYTLSYSSVTTIKYMITSPLGKDTVPKTKIEKKKGNFGISNEFIKLYTTDEFYNRFKHGGTDMDICRYINSMVSNNDGFINYQSTVDSLSFSHGLFKSSNFPKSLWGSLKSLASPLPMKLIIKDREIIDWISNYYETIKELHQMEYKMVPIIKLQTKELIEYAKLKLQSNFLNHQEIISSFYLYTFSFAINNCDVSTLKYLDCNFNEKIDKFNKISKSNLSTTDKLIRTSIYQIKDAFNKIFNLINFRDMIIKFENHTTSNLIELVDYLNSTNYNLFTPNLFKEFINCLVIASKKGDIDLSKLKINFNQFPKETIELFIESITNIKSPETIQLILNNGFSLFSTTYLNLLKECWGLKSVDRYDTTFFYFYHGYKSDLDVYPLNQSCLYFLGTEGERNHCTSAESSNDIVRCIELLLSQFNNIIKTNYDSLLPTSLEETAIVFQNFINHLFRRLIKVYCVVIDKVKYIYQLINTSWNSSTLNTTIQSFKFEHSLYHSYFYLGVRSLKFIRFILSLPSTYNVKGSSDFDNNSTNYEDPNEYYSEFTSGNIMKYINPNIFTYDFIFNSSFSSVLETLIQHLVYDPAINSVISTDPNKSYVNNLPTTLINSYYEMIEKTLEFLMEIREVDLFFKQLDKIQIQLDDINFKIGTFPTTHKNHNDYNSTKEDDDKKCLINDFYTELRPVIGGRYIYFSTNLIQNALAFLDLGSFYKLCKYCSYLSMDFYEIGRFYQPASGQNLTLFKELLNYFNKF